MKIGLLGGTFDPPHFGHLGISLEALELLSLDKVWWLPTKQNPLKKLVNCDFGKRLKLCRKISKNEPKIIVKDLEKNLSSSYFIDLLEVILKENPTDEFYFLIGADNLANFHLWQRWWDIAKLVKIAVFEREHYQDLAKKSIAVLELEKRGQKDRLIFLKNKKYDISSTKIRESK